MMKLSPISNVVPQITPAELVVLKTLWKRSPLTAAEVVEDLSGETTWKPKTIHTLLKRLVVKGALQQEKNGREYRFSPTLAEDEFTLHASRSFLSRFFDGELAPFLSCFLKHEKLSKNEIQELKRLVQKLK